ncbi:MAG: tetratricopeptide repeat protein [Actinobacteria bacterium]|nr:tetratricopeptide repeat protein [Actinomycetota bacterium]
MVDVTDATFQQLVLDRSMHVPVVIDLWAEWCGPCKTLGPFLEAVIAETAGRVEFAKVDVDVNPQIANAFKVQSIPAVFAMHQQQIVDQFLGAQPEATVREFVQRLLPTREESEVERLYAAGDEASLRAALELEPTNENVVLALATLLIADGRHGDAEPLLNTIPENAEVRRLRALMRTGLTAGGSADLFGELDGLLERVKADEEARQRFVDLLEVMGDDPRVGEYRRKLMTRLY